MRGFARPLLAYQLPVRRSRAMSAALGSCALAICSPGVSLAGDAGLRDFPATLVVEEPQVETEFVPQVATRKNGNNARQSDFESELSVQLTNPFAVVLHPTFTVLHPGGNGFQNLETTLKYQFIADAEHEVVFSAGLSNAWSGIGARRVGADPFSTVTPVVFFGKGAGDLPESLDWARPFALTAQAGFDIPTQRRSPVLDTTDSNLASDDAVPVGPFEANPYFASLQGSFQYSLVYAAENLPGLNVPKFMAALVPLVEYSFQIPVANNGAHFPTIGTINPGFLWCHGNVQIGVEAIIPINRDSGRHPGVRVQLAYAFETPWIKHAEPPAALGRDGKDRD
jgi:hypothetical protein